MSKGTETRERIVEHAYRVATRDGLEGLSIGTLATDLGLSKSGLFAHFGSKEALQVDVLKAASESFEELAIRPALHAPRGEPRVRALFELWLQWMDRPENVCGCLLTAAAAELDDRPGPPRDYLNFTEKQHMGMLVKAARLAVGEGHFRPDTDTKLFAFEWKGIMLAYHQLTRLLRDPAAESLARAAFERLIASVHAV